MGNVQSRREWESAWTPLLQGAVVADADRQYRAACWFFLDWAGEHWQRPMLTAADVDDAMTEYAWWLFDTRGGTGRWRLHMALYGIGRYLPAL